MGLFDNMRAKAAERAAEKKRLAEEKRQKELERLSQLSDREILIEIRLLLDDYGERISRLENNVDSMSGEVSQMYINDLTEN